jgi:arginase family enzyme
MEISNTALVLSENGKVPFFIGGDHLVSLGAIGGVLEGLQHQGRQKIQVLHFDAHSDYMEISNNHFPTHGSFMAEISGLSGVEKIVQVGVRGYSTFEDPLPNKFANAKPNGITQHLVPGMPLYLTIDTDAFDPMVAPAVGHPEFDGLAWEHLHAAVKEIGVLGIPIVGIDWVEYNPTLDTKNYLCGRAIVHQILKILSEVTKQTDLT